LLKEKLEIENRLKEKEKKIEEKKNIDSKISSIEITIRGKTDLELRLKKEIMLMQRQANEEIDFSDEKIRNVISLLESHKKNLEEKNSGFLRLVSQISVLKSKKEEYQKLVDQVSSLENCPTCFQNVGHQHKEKISKKTKVDIDSIKLRAGT
jgi:chromosome segregation ATPase